MPFYFFHWDDELVEHLSQHNVSVDEFEAIVMHSRSQAKSQSTGREIYFGWTEDCRYVACVFEWLDADTVLPITAYEVEN